MTCSKENVKCRAASEFTGKTARHPCYSFEAHHKFARMHLPVAPMCNISCNYCNRKFDCANESRPGVTSQVLHPEEALKKFLLVRQRMDNLSVVGIAGPGDALANWHNTKKTVSLIKQADPGVILCLSTNGLMLPEYAREIVKMGIEHVTVTVNCLDPVTGGKVYQHIHYKGHKYKGAAGAEILIANQQAGIACLADNGVLVKVNIVMMHDINDFQIPGIVRRVKQLGAFITNIMPLVPAQGSVFAGMPPTDTGKLDKMRDACSNDLRQMRHCKQCRADAVGLLENDRSAEFDTLTGIQETIKENPKEKDIAAAS